MSKEQNWEDQGSEPLKLASEPQMPQALFILQESANQI